MNKRIMGIKNKAKFSLAIVDIAVGIAFARYVSYAELLERLAEINDEEENKS